MEKQQTAVEWLMEQIPLGFRMYLAENGIDLAQAKAMEKQQIMDAANTLLYHSTGPGNTAAEQYYNKTYEKE